LNTSTENERCKCRAKIALDVGRGGRLKVQIGRRCGLSLGSPLRVADQVFTAMHAGVFLGGFCGSMLLEE
jgi:hypothetical protein